MPTLMKPADLAGLNPSTYQKALEKDLARLGRGQKWESFVYITEYKMGAKKTALLVFADAGDKDWDDVIKAAKAKGKKYTTGTCKVAIVPDQDGNGKDDIEITIKEAKGDYNKKKVAESIKEEIFAEDVDVRTSVLAGDGDEDEAIVEEAPHAPEAATTGLDHEKEVLAAKEKLDSFMQAFQDFMAKIGPAQALQAGTQQKLQTLQANQGAPDILKQANAAAHELRIQITDFDEIIEVGQAWFEKHKNKVKDLFGISGYKEKMEAAKERIMNLKRLQRFLTQAEDFIEEKYLHDFAGVDESKLKEEQDKADALFGFVKEGALDFRTKFQAKQDLNQVIEAIKFTESRLAEYADIDNSLKTPQQLKFVADVEKTLAPSRTVVDNMLLESLEGAAALLKDYKAYRLMAAPSTFAECSTQINLLTDFIDRVTDLKGDVNKLGQLVNSFKSELGKLQTMAFKRFGNAKINELLDKARAKGELNAENLFDAFVEEFKGTAKYTPKNHGNLFEGNTQANCQDFCTSFQKLLMAASLSSKIVVYETYFLTSAIDGTWMDPTAPGNTYVVGRPAERRYFFSDHWVIESGGQQFCPTSGYKLAAIRDTVAVVVGADQKDNFENDVCKFSKPANPSENGGFTYRVEFK